MGGYFSQLVISALYPIHTTEALGTLIGGGVTNVQSLQIPIDTAARLDSAQVPAVSLLVALSPVPYMNLEQPQILSSAAVTGVNLVATIVFVTYMNLEQPQILSSAAVTGVNLV